MSEWKLCPKCADQVLKNVELHVDITEVEPSWRFRIRAFFAKYLFRLGALILGSSLRMRTWGIHDGGKCGDSEG